MLNAPYVATALVAVAACGLATGFVSGRVNEHTRYLVSIERVEQASFAARKQCEPLSGSEWERCITRALSEKWQAIAEAEVAHRNTPESYRVQRFVAAGAALLMGAGQCSVLPVLARVACDRAALEAFREAADRAAASDLTGGDCSLAGCPNQLNRRSRASPRPRIV
jgi:hypothetical protein